MKYFSERELFITDHKEYISIDVIQDSCHVLNFKEFEEKDRRFLQNTHFVR